MSEKETGAQNRVGGISSDASGKVSWARQLDSSQFSLQESIGGVRGAIESLLPGLLFVVAYVATRELSWPLILSGGLAAIFVVARLVQRSTLTQAFAGMFGVLIGVVWAALSGKAENYFAWGLITNAVFLTAMLLSLAFRHPAVAWLVHSAVGLPVNWRELPEAKIFTQRAVWATWVWVGVFAIRLAVQVPLYFGGHVAWLGVLKLLLGLPLFAIAGWLNWVLLRSVVPHPQESAEGSGAAASEARGDTASEVEAS